MHLPPDPHPPTSPPPVPLPAQSFAPWGPLQGCKICGITDAAEGAAIAQLGATALGFICVAASPRYVEPERLATLNATLNRAIAPDPATRAVARIGVFANAPCATVLAVAQRAQLTGVQLHGDESPEDCAWLRAQAPQLTVWKALRVRSPATLELAATYAGAIDAVLLDAYRPGVLGGTGAALSWPDLVQFRPPMPWILAGGLNPENVLQALAALADNPPWGIDLSSGVERSPGRKDLDAVNRLFQQLAHLKPGHPA